MLNQVDLRSSVPAYEQIENQVRLAIASGELKEGDRLPRIQELAKRLDLNQNTIIKAYRDLELMGIIGSRGWMGVFVNEGVEAKCRDAIRSDCTERLFETVGEAKAAGMTLKEIRETIATIYSSTSVSQIAKVTSKEKVRG